MTKMVFAALVPDPGVLCSGNPSQVPVPAPPPRSPAGTAPASSWCRGRRGWTGPCFRGVLYLNPAKKSVEPSLGKN